MSAAGSVRVACVQLRSARETAPNVAAATELIREAAAAGAELIATPEMTGMFEPERAKLREKVRAPEEDAAVHAFQALAAEIGRHLLIGSIAVARPDGGVANRSFLFGPDGRLAATYDKIHMFDVEVSATERYNESATYTPGDQAVVAALPSVRLGLSICYDLRFPHLFRHLAQAGAELIAIPAAFTEVTGRAHWHVLVRARAIETGAFVMAPAQGGTHDSGRQTFGHSLIVDPWGEVLAEGGKDPGVIWADLDLAKMADARRRVPAWQRPNVTF